MNKFYFASLLLVVSVFLSACSGCGADSSEAAVSNSTAAANNTQPKKVAQNKPTKIELNGVYNAIIAPDKVQPEFAAASRASLIRFTFNPDGTLLYDVAAMGNQNKDSGKYRIANDKLIMYDLGRGPDSEFSIQVLDDGRIRIDGPNSFILTKVSE